MQYNLPDIASSEDILVQNSQVKIAVHNNSEDRDQKVLFCLIFWSPLFITFIYLTMNYIKH